MKFFGTIVLMVCLASCSPSPQGKEAGNPSSPKTLGNKPLGKSADGSMAKSSPEQTENEGVPLSSLQPFGEPSTPKDVPPEISPPSEPMMTRTGSFVLPLGGQHQIFDEQNHMMTVTFLDVLVDHRCARHVRCKDPGEAVIKIKINSAIETTQIDLRLGELVAHRGVVWHLRDLDRGQASIDLFDVD